MLERQGREQQFHDRIFVDGTRRVADKYYSVLRASRLFYEEFLTTRCCGSVLEYGCGPGSYAFYLAERGAYVTGIDISPTAIALASQRRPGQTKGEVEFRVMDAERLSFESDAFDLICGTAILHHLDLDTAFRELARVMRPGGAAVFMEPLGHNPLINLYRRLTPALRTVDEHPLTMADLLVARKYFGRVEPRFFTLQSLLAVPLRHTRVFKRAVTVLDGADAFVFRHVPMARRYAWQVVLTLAEPRVTA